MTTAPPGLLWTILSFVLVIGPLIFVHELGHYLVGRLCGVKADIFSIGFGRELFGWTDKRGTRWKVSLLPLGGYVKFAGDMNAAGQPSDEWLMLPAEERARTFQAKPVWQRFLIVFAGPFTNFFVAIVIIAGFVYAAGNYATPPVIAKVEPASAAAQAGLQPNDTIVALDGQRIETFDDVRTALMLRREEPVRVDFLRGGKPMTAVARLKMTTDRDTFGNEQRRALLGVLPVPGHVISVSPVGAVGPAVHDTVRGRS